MSFLKSLEIQNFRLFKALKVDRLERVNLVVGRNNVGKTTLLDAFFLHAWRGHPVAIWQILTLHELLHEEARVRVSAFHY